MFIITSDEKNGKSERARCGECKETAFEGHLYMKS